jgi:hypothetical protein
MKTTKKIVAITAGAVVAVAAVGGIATAATSTTLAAGDSPAGLRMAPVTPLPVPAEGVGAPDYLPSGAELSHTHRRDDGSGSAVYSYSLAGPANQSTITPEAMARDPKSVHPASELTVYYASGIRELPELPVDAEYFESTKVSVNGADAVVSTPRNGFGAHRIDWVDRSGYHTVLSDRLITDHGKSGIGIAELTKVAESITL